MLCVCVFSFSSFFLHCFSRAAFVHCTLVATLSFAISLSFFLLTLFAVFILFCFCCFYFVLFFFKQNGFVLNKLLCVNSLPLLLYCYRLQLDRLFAVYFPITRLYLYHIHPHPHHLCITNLIVLHHLLLLFFSCFFLLIVI